MAKEHDIEGLPDLQDLLVNTSLYTNFRVADSDYVDVYNLIYSLSPIDCFCVECSNHSVFTPIDNTPLDYDVHGEPYPISVSIWGMDFSERNQIYEKQYYCSRNNKHKLTFYIQIKSGNLTKVGQSPALAEIAEQDIKKYRKILGAYYSEFSRAIGLFAHGVGVGSFVYLRRVIENFVIKPAYDAAKLEEGWDDENYKKLRVGEKIKMLKDHLPEFFVQNTAVYGIVSKGIHELTEQECNQYFPVLKSFLEVVLIELGAQRALEDKKKSVQAEIDKIAAKT